VPIKVVDRINERVMELNAKSTEDTKKLDKGFEIGHSYFCPSPEQRYVNKN
jgi:hypothetical protein